MKLRQAIKVQRNQRAGRRYRGSTAEKARKVCANHWYDLRVTLDNFATATAGPCTDGKAEYRRALAVMEKYGPPPLRLAMIDWMHWKQFAILPSRRILVGTPTA